MFIDSEFVLLCWFEAFFEKKKREGIPLETEEGLRWARRPGRQGALVTLASDLPVLRSFCPFCDEFMLLECFWCLELDLSSSSLCWCWTVSFFFSLLLPSNGLWWYTDVFALPWIFWMLLLKKLFWLAWWYWCFSSPSQLCFCMLLEWFNNSFFFFSPILLYAFFLLLANDERVEAFVFGHWFWFLVIQVCGFRPYGSDMVYAGSTGFWNGFVMIEVIVRQVGGYNWYRQDLVVFCRLMVQDVWNIRFRFLGHMVWWFWK